MSSMTVELMETIDSLLTNHLVGGADILLVGEEGYDFDMVFAMSAEDYAALIRKIGESVLSAVHDVGIGPEGQEEEG